MDSELKVNGKQNFMGVNIPIIEGGFGKDKRVVTAKTVSEIHNMETKEITKSINRLIEKKRLQENIDYIDVISQVNSLPMDLEIIFGIKPAYLSRTNNIFILSERGYTKLIKSMDDDKSWEVMDKFIDSYFMMREVINSDENLKALALLKAIEGSTTEERLNGITLYTNYKVQEATEPLIKEIEYKEDVIIGLVDEITLADKRQILNRVVRHNHANYQLRWSMLYKEFEAKYHCNIQQRLDSYNRTNQPKCTNKVDYIETVMKKLPELYEIAAKLFHTDIEELQEQLYRIK